MALLQTSFILFGLLLAGCSSINPKYFSGSAATVDEVIEHGTAQSLVYHEFGLNYTHPSLSMEELLSQSFDKGKYEIFRNACLVRPCVVGSAERKALTTFIQEQQQKDKKIEGYLIRDLFFHALKIQNDLEMVEIDHKTSTSENLATTTIGIKSKEILSILYEFRPSDQEILYQYAFSIMKTGDGKDALPIVLKLFNESNIERQKINYGLILVNLYEENEHFEESKKIYGQLMKLDSKNQELCYRWVKSTQVIDGISAALNNFQNCKKAYEEGGLAQYYFIKGRLHLEGNEMSKAKKAFENSFKEDSSYGPAILAKAIIAEEMGDQKEAIEYNERYLNLNPQDTKTISKLVDLYIEKKLFDKAANLLLRIVQKSTTDPAIVRKYVLLLYEIKNYEEIIKFLPPYLKVNKKIEDAVFDQYLALIFSSFQALNRSYEGVPYLRLVQVKSNFFQFSILAQLEILRDRGTELRNKYTEIQSPEVQDLLKELILLSKQASQSDAEEFRFFADLATSFKYDFENEGKQAISILKPWFKKDLFISQYSYYVAELYLKLKDMTGMEDFLGDYLRTNPKDHHAWNFLGYAQLELEVPDLQKAEKYLQTALDLAPQDPYIMDSFAWLMFHKKDYSQAIKYLKMALKKTPHEWDMVKHLALVYRAKGNLAEASKILSQFAQSAAGRVINKEIEEFLNSWASLPENIPTQVDRTPSSEK